MPELPEVEVTRRRIEPLLLGRKIARVITSEPSYFYLTPPDQIRRALEYAGQISVEDGPKSRSQPAWNQAPDRRR